MVRSASAIVHGSDAPLVRAIVVDRDRRIVESDVAALSVGSVVTRASWLGGAILDAVEGASRREGSSSRTARDDTRGTHWIVRALVDEGGDETAPSPSSDAPWRARVIIVDATLAVANDRSAVLGKLVHAMQNSCFALQSVVEAITEDKPAGRELDEYVAHLREPTERISATMSRLNTFLIAPDLARAPIDVAAFIAHAVAALPEARRPTSVRMSDAPMRVSIDRDRLSEAFAVMFDGDDPAAVLEVDAATIDGRSFARILVERRELLAEDRTLGGHWDLAGGHRFEMALRFSIARAIVLAHGGEVVSSSEVLPSEGAAAASATKASNKNRRARLGLYLPLMIDE